LPSVRGGSVVAVRTMFVTYVVVIVAGIVAYIVIGLQNL
jgi:hypothetical protein